MVEWKVIENAVRGFLTTRNLTEAEKAIASGLKSFPNQINLLVVASDVYRASSNHEKSLEHAKLLIKHYPHQPNGYIRSAQDLIDLGEKLEAQKIIEEGIKVAPDNLYLLLVSREAFRRTENREKCLQYSLNLIIYHPNDWRGYGRAAQDLVALERFEEAQAIINLGLEKIPNQVDLLTIAIDVYRASGDHEISLEYAELLITSHPNNWIGYERAAQGLVTVKRFEEARKTINEGLGIIPNQVELKKYLAYTNSFLGARVASISDSEKGSISLNPNDLISYSSIPNFYKIIQSKQKAEFKEGKTCKKYVFVAGLGRSGTTALCQMLNISETVAVYNELYSAFRIDGYSQSDFAEKKVVHKLESSANSMVNSQIAIKSLNSKTIIGDKTPYFQFCAEATFNNLGIEDTRCIFIDRSLADVCRSSHKRSENPNDLKWSLEKGVEHTILLYNASCRQIIHLHDNRPDIFSSFLFPTYEDTFSSAKKAFELFDFCGIELLKSETDQVKAFIRNSQKHVSNKFDPSHSLEIHIRDSISKLLDQNVHKRFCVVTGNHRDYPSNRP